MLASAHCRSLPSEFQIESLSGNRVVPLVRKARQFGIQMIYNNRLSKIFTSWTYLGGGNGGHNNFDYNPYNDTPDSYDSDTFNDSTRRILYPFTETRVNYLANSYNVPGVFGKK